MRTQRVLIIEEHRLLREGLSALLAQTPRIEVVGAESGNGEISSLIAQTKPDILLIDPFMSNGKGRSSIRLSKRHFPRVGVVALTGQRSKEHVCDALNAGVDAYVLKQDSWQMLLEAIRNADLGGMYLSASLWKTPRTAPPVPTQGEHETHPLDDIAECALASNDSNPGNTVILGQFRAQRSRYQAIRQPRSVGATNTQGSSGLEPSSGPPPRLR